MKQNNLLTLIKMQLKDKIDFGFLLSTKQTIFKIVLTLIKFIVVAAIAFVAFYVLSYLRLVSVVPGIPQNFITVLLSVMLILSIITCTYGLMKNLYFTKDNQLLLTLPVTRTQMFTSKLVVFYCYEVIKNTFFYLPILIAYGIINGFPIWAYLWLIVDVFLLTAVPVCIGALLSIPAMYIAKFLKQYKVLGYILLVLFIAGIITGVVFVITAIPENINLIADWATTFKSIQNILNTFVNIFTPLAWLVTALIGTRYGIANQLFTSTQVLYILGAIAFCAVVFGLAYLLVRPLYFKMASSPFEFKKTTKTKTYKNKKHHFILSSIKKDMILMARSPEKFVGLFSIAVVMPIAILLLNKIYGAMDTRLAGQQMAMIFNFFIIMLFALSTNINLAHVYSEEGASNYHLRTNPQAHTRLLLSKLVLNFVVMTISVIISVAIFTKFSGFSVQDAIFSFLIVECTFIAHMAWSAELDIMHPQTAQYQMVGHHVSNPNDTKSSVFMFLLSALVTFLIFFFIGEGQSVGLIKIFVFVALFMALRIWLYINKIKVYFKERQ